MAAEFVKLRVCQVASAKLRFERLHACFRSRFLDIGDLVFHIPVLVFDTTCVNAQVCDVSKSQLYEIGDLRLDELASLRYRYSC